MSMQQRLANGGHTMSKQPSNRTVSTILTTDKYNYRKLTK